MKADIQDVKRNVDSKLDELCPIGPRVFAPQLDLTALSTLKLHPVSLCDRYFHLRLECFPLFHLSLFWPCWCLELALSSVFDLSVEA